MSRPARPDVSLDTLVDWFGDVRLELDRIVDRALRALGDRDPDTDAVRRSYADASILLHQTWTTVDRWNTWIAQTDAAAPAATTDDESDAAAWERSVIEAARWVRGTCSRDIPGKGDHVTEEQGEALHYLVSAVNGTLAEYLGDMPDDEREHTLALMKVGIERARGIDAEKGGAS